VLVDEDVDIEHGDLAEELGELLLRSHVVLLDEALLDLLLNQLLRLGVVGVSVTELGHLLLLLALGFELDLELLANDLLEQLGVVLLEGGRQLWVVLLEEDALVGVAAPDVLDVLDLSLDLLVLLVVEDLVEHLVEVHLGHALDVTLQTREEIVQQVLVVGVDAPARLLALNHARHLGKNQHVVVLHSKLSQHLSILSQLLILEENGLITNWDLRLDFK